MKIIVANWKLNPEKAEEAQKLVKAINLVKPKSKVIICPPAIYLGLLKTKNDLGVQDIFWQEKGAYTGQISGSMLRQFKVKYAIVGHSERRELGESDHEVNLKADAALRNKITPIICVGYGLTASDSEEDIFLHLQNQLAQDLNGLDPEKVIVAYEPVWAIGSGKPADPEHAERVAMFIRIKFKIRKILYGGSTNSSNFSSYLKKNIDGLLVGGSSLRKEEFIKMII